MSQMVVTMPNRFDLAALDALLGPKGFVSALDHHAQTGFMRYAALNRDNFDDGTRVRITASYALGFPGRGRRLYTLLTLDLRVHQDDVATVLGARRLGRLAPAAPLTEALMAFARPLAGGVLPDHAQLTPFLPPSLLDALDNTPSAADFPDAGIDREERLPEPLWDRPAVLHNDRIDPDALAVTLNLAVGERTELADMNPHTGDYRVFHLGVAATSAGGENLTFELHRQGPGFESRVFNALSLRLGPPNAEGLCSINAFTCDAGAEVADLPRLLPELARIAAALQARKRPEDALLLPFLSEPAQALWTQPLVKKGGS